MRRGLAILLFLLPACAQEPSFDERFEETQERIDQKAEELERELEEPQATQPPAERG